MTIASRMAISLTARFGDSVLSGHAPALGALGANDASGGVECMVLLRRVWPVVKAVECPGTHGHQPLLVLALAVRFGGKVQVIRPVHPVKADERG